MEAIGKKTNHPITQTNNSTNYERPMHHHPPTTFHFLATVPILELLASAPVATEQFSHTQPSLSRDTLQL
jgi:hypothetical protein